MTTLIRQRAPSDCTLCCLAMALGLTYDELGAKLGPAFMALVSKLGTTDNEENAMFEALQLRKDADFQELILSPHWCSLAFAKNMLWGRRAIIAVRSKNTRDGLHNLYWDGRALFDPSNKDDYQDFREVEPISFFIFQERT